MGSGSSVDHASGGVGGVLASLTTMVKECCGSSFLIIPPWLLLVEAIKIRYMNEFCELLSHVKYTSNVQHFSLRLTGPSSAVLKSGLWFGCLSNKSKLNNVFSF